MEVRFNVSKKNSGKFFYQKIYEMLLRIYLLICKQRGDLLAFVRRPDLCI